MDRFVIIGGLFEATEEQFLGRKIRPMASRKSLFPELFSWKRGFHILANRGISFVTDTETRNIPTTRVTSVLATPSFLSSFFLFHRYFLTLWILRLEKKKILYNRNYIGLLCDTSFPILVRINYAVPLRTRSWTRVQ